MATEPGKGEAREQFGSRIAFYFAAVGSAVGFGNVWRFPGLAYKFGGGPFFIPYLMALFLIGIPVLFLEISLGQYYQRGDVSVFGGIHKRMRGVGLLSVVCSYLLFSYYSMLITWVLRALFESGNSSAPWGQENVTSDASYAYFLNEIIGMKYLGDDTMPTRLIGQNVLYALVTFACVYLCNAFGLKLTGRITYVTMGLPIILLLLFLIRGATLEGSSDGIRAYIGEWDLTVLSEEGEVWSEAVTQIFFSLSVTFGVMTAYGSHMKRDEPAFTNTMVVALANSMFSFIAGFAVFSAIGHKAFIEGKEISELDNLTSFGLVFGTWPVVLGSLPGGIHWIRLLFVNLFLLGLDSAFSMVEGLVTCVHDTARFRNTPKWKIAAAFCIGGYVQSLLYATDGGLFFLDVVDWYINFVMLFVGFLETFTVGWIYGIEKQIDRFGARVFFAYMITTFGSVLLASGLWFGLEENAIWAGFLALAITYSVGMAVTIVLLLLRRMEEGEESSETLGAAMIDLAFGNMRDYKNTLEPVIGWVPTAWCLLVKHFIPQVLLILFINLATSENANGKFNFGNYGDYPIEPYQAIGIFVVCLSIAVFSVGLLFPDVYNGLVSYDDKALEGDKPSFPVAIKVEDAEGDELEVKGDEIEYKGELKAEINEFEA